MDNLSSNRPEGAAAPGPNADTEHATDPVDPVDSGAAETAEDLDTAGETAAAPAAALGPVTVRDRIASIDVLRGVAVLGILAMNIYAFAMPWAAYQNPLEWGGSDRLNLGVWYFTHFVFDQKFMSIFSMLFGAGLILMFERAGDRPIGKIWYRRQFWLLMIGLVHAYLIWFGDILVPYAMVGMLVFLVRRWPAKRLVIVGSLWMLPTLLLGTGSAFMQHKMSGVHEIAQEKLEAGEALTPKEQEAVEMFSSDNPFAPPTEEKILETIEVYRHGSYLEIVHERAPMVAIMQIAGFLFFGLWRIGGLMMLGMGLMKLGVFSAARSDGFYTKLMAWGYGLGLPLVALSAWHLTGSQWDHLRMQKIDGYWNFFGSVGVALGHIALVMLIVRRGWLRALVDRLSAVGRMAFTNYLMQSILCTLLFYSYGLGLFGTFDRWQQMLVVPTVWALQLAYSPWWLARFRFGPAEWMWRSLTYGKKPRLRRDETIPVTASS
ncbi:MAG: DUF418 domain-containing protein [Acidobacteriota bacterium]